MKKKSDFASASPSDALTREERAEILSRYQAARQHVKKTSVSVRPEQDGRVGAGYRKKESSHLAYDDLDLAGERALRKAKRDELRRMKQRAKFERRRASMEAVRSPQGSRTLRYAKENQTAVKKMTAEDLARDLSQQAAAKAGVAETAAKISSDSIHFRPPRHVHMGILVTVLVLLCFGLIMLFSASMANAFDDQGNSAFYVIRQVIFTLLGIVLMYFLTKINPKHWNKIPFAALVYLVTTVLLVLVLIPGIGIRINGQQRWLPFVIVPKMSFQPSEIAKLAVIYCGAVYYSTLRKLRTQGRLAARSSGRQVVKDLYYDFLLPLMLVAVWCFLISRQSHMSSVLIILLVLLIVFLAGSIRPRSWAIMAGLLLVMTVLALLLFMTFKSQIMAAVETSPQLKHLLVRFDIFSAGSDSAITDASYQSRLAIIGIGSGGFGGVGLGLGRQKFNWLPEIHNDYVYSNICEELGFLGGGLVILLFALFFILGMSITMRTQSIYLQTLAAGFSSLIAIQAFLSIAVNLMVIPPTGISLPLFSYGGTSNLFFLIGIGFLLSVSKYGPKDSQQAHAALTAEKKRSRRQAHVHAGQEG